MTRPFVSILIPTHNRHNSLKRCIAACQRLEYPKECVEILVIDDGSSPPVPAYDGVQLLRQEQNGPASARNAALGKAKGEFVVFTDDDCEPEPQWLMELVKAHRHNPSAMVGGRTVNGLPENVFSSASQCLVDYVYAFFEQHEQSLRFFTSNNFGGAALELGRLDGFDTSFPLPAAEDRDLSERWSQLVFAPAAVVTHYHHLNLSGFCNQHFRYGRGAYTLFRRREKRGTNRRLLKNQFYPGLFQAPFRNSAVQSPWTVLALLLLSQTANVLGFVYESFQTQQS
ncbi:glycosyltransferase [Bryobacter aggregatus]|uniref:glycosyltransferase n=1 Tax=Bryobacter aggregatus TaxID=360054 RepID=UPI0004E18BEA|nr:glycosyltransferase [Bryobacter aggregatus]